MEHRGARRSLGGASRRSLKGSSVWRHQSASSGGRRNRKQEETFALSREYVLLLWHQATPGAGEIEQGGFTSGTAAESHRSPAPFLPQALFAESSNHWDGQTQENCAPGSTEKGGCTLALLAVRSVISLTPSEHSGGFRSSCVERETFPRAPTETPAEAAVLSNPVGSAPPISLLPGTVGQVPGDNFMRFLQPRNHRVFFC